MAACMERVAAAIEHVLTSGGGQLASTLLAPGSTFSIAALACSLAVFVMLAAPPGRKRRLRTRSLRRALFPGRLWRSASGRADIAFVIFGVLFSGLAIGWAVFSADQVRALAGGWLGVAGPGRVPGWAGTAIATAALFLAYEFAYWSDHWLMHNVPFLWRFHKVHHQAESLSLATNFRVHPLETIGFANIQALYLGTTGAVLERTLGAGVSAWTLGGTNLLILLFAVTLNHLQHSHLWLGFGPRWGKWLLGPAPHQIHHSANPAHFGCNLGSSLTLFDRLFGTFRMPAARREVLRFGVEDGETTPHGLRAALFAPFLPGPRPEPALPATAARS
jgi:sterol desaturase/sphingolipid hydroxylase (fatty acid hydroxylase superfamily)